MKRSKTCSQHTVYLSSSSYHVRYEVSVSRSIQQVNLQTIGLKLLLSNIHSNTSERRERDNENKYCIRVCVCTCFFLLQSRQVSMRKGKRLCQVSVNQFRTFTNKKTKKEIIQYLLLSTHSLTHSLTHSFTQSLTCALFS